VLVEEVNKGSEQLGFLICAGVEGAVVKMHLSAILTTFEATN